jgi:hypothetical protein
MAIHRRPVTLAVPAELIMYNKEDWPGPEWVSWSSNGVSWTSPFDRWIKARRAYSKQHPDSDLGSILDQMRFERRMRMLNPPKSTFE